MVVTESWSKECSKCTLYGAFSKFPLTSQSSHLKNHMRVHTEKPYTCMWFLLLSIRKFENTYASTYWRKALQMHSMWLLLLSIVSFEESYESTYWKTLHMHVISLALNEEIWKYIHASTYWWKALHLFWMWLLLLSLKLREESYENSDQKIRKDKNTHSWVILKVKFMFPYYQMP